MHNTSSMCSSLNWHTWSARDLLRSPHAPRTQPMLLTVLCTFSPVTSSSCSGSTAVPSAGGGTAWRQWGRGGRGGNGHAITVEYNIHLTSPLPDAPPLCSILWTYLFVLCDVLWRKLHKCIFGHTGNLPAMYRVVCVTDTSCVLWISGILLHLQIRIMHVEVLIYIHCICISMLQILQALRTLDCWPISYTGPRT